MPADAMRIASVILWQEYYLSTLIAKFAEKQFNWGAICYKQRLTA